MTVQNRVMSQKAVSGDRAERALRELDDPLFADLVVKDLRRRSSFTGVAGRDLHPAGRPVKLDHFDPRRANDIVAVVNRMLDAGHAPEAATVWWTTPTSSLPGRRAPIDLLGQDHAELRELAAAYVTGADL